MATLVLAAAGAVLAPAGYAAVGWAVGSLVGNLLFPPKGPSTEGPRLNDLKVQASTLGVMIPLDFGTVAHAGNIIWSTDRREHRHEEEVGGKGGPSATAVTYTYTIDMAIGLSDRNGIDPIIGVRKIWRDGKLWYSAGDDATVETILASNAGAAGIKIYLGSETQLPDPTIEAALGAGNVPAYRGLAYIVFTDLDLPNGQMSNWQFEICASGTFSNPLIEEQTFTSPGRYFAQSALMVGRGDVASTYFGLGEWDASYPPSSYVTVFRSFVGGEPEYFTRFAVPVTGRAVHGQSDVPAFVTTHEAAETPGGRLYAFLIDADTGAVTSQPIRMPSSVTPRGEGGPSIHIRGDHIYYFSPFENDYVIVRYLRSGTAAEIFPETAWSITSLGLPGVVHAIAVAETQIYALLRNDSIVVFDLDMNEIASHAFTPVGGLEYVYYTGEAMFAERDGEVVIFNDERLSTVDTNTGEYRYVGSLENGGAYYNTVGRVGNLIIQADVGSTSSEIQKLRYWQIDALTPGAAPTRASIITELCKRAGLTAGDINVSALSGSEDGYTVGRPGSIRSAIDPLQKAGFFDAVESDGKLKFVTRGAAAVRTITQADLAAHEWGADAPEPITLTRAQELELPQQVTVNFLNRGQDYEQGSQYDRRLITDSDVALVEELSIVMTDARAAQVANVLLYDAWTQRNRVSFSTTREHAKLEPTDVIAVQTDIATYPLRITRKEESGPVIRWDAIAEDIAIYNSNSVGTSQPARTSQIALQGPTRLELLDIPIVRDQDDDVGPYVAMAGYLDGWRGAVLYKSDDGVAYTAVDSVASEAVMGTADTALGNFLGGNVFDEHNVVRVTIRQGTLASATEAQVLAGANAAVIGSEIVQYKNAILVSGKTYDLSGLLRGRRGTEQHIGTHVAGERFVRLATTGMLRLDNPTTDIGATRYYKAVTFEQSIAGASAQTLVNAANGLKPLSAVLLGAGLANTSGDITLTWTRRTRIGGEWRDYIDAPLGESSEAYEVEIYSSSGFTTLKRTITGLTSPSATYTAAQQTTDFGGLQTTVHFRVYQISATVGRGFAAQASRTI